MSTTVIETQSSTSDDNFVAAPSHALSGPVTAHLKFFMPPVDGSPAQYLVDAGPDGKTVETFGREVIPVSISDIRGRESSFSISRNAFAAVKNVQSDSSIDWADDESIKTKYYPEVERLVRESVDGDASKIVIFDHTIRVADPNAYREPVQLVHVDQTPYSTTRRVRRHIASPEESEKLLQGRYRIINVWRPLTQGPVVSYPLAVASADSTSAADISPIQHVYPNGYIGEHAGVKYNPEQKWHYWSGMTSNERLLLQCFDSQLGTDGGRTPHTAFADPRTPSDAEPRKSIEVRALVFA